VNRFELARYEAGLTIAEAAQKARVSIRTIRRAEDEETEQPTAPVVKRLAVTYEKKVAWLLDADDRAAA
jgi:transcriptional regulator with XRE-family HTH domain